MRDDADVDPRGRASARTGAARIRHALLSAAALRGRTRARRIELRGKVCGCGQARRRADGPCPPLSPVAVLTLARVPHRRSHPVRPQTPPPADAGRRTAAAADGRCSAAAYMRAQQARPCRFDVPAFLCERRRLPPPSAAVLSQSRRVRGSGRCGRGRKRRLACACGSRPTAAVSTHGLHLGM